MRRVINWARRALQKFIFEPDPSVIIEDVPADVLLIRAEDGRPLIAVNKIGDIGVRQVVNAYRVSPRISARKLS